MSVCENLGFLTLVMKYLAKSDSFQDFHFESDIVSRISLFDFD